MYILCSYKLADIQNVKTRTITVNVKAIFVVLLGIQNSIFAI